MKPIAICLAALSALLSGAPSSGGEAPSGPSARAVIVPSHDIEVVSPVGGVIKRVLVKEGDRVEKDQPLIELDAEVAQAALAISEERAKSTARVDAAQANVSAKAAAYKRQKRLHEKGVASDEDLDEAELEMKAAQAQFIVAKEERVLQALEVKRDRAIIARLTIRAPLAGLVARRIQDVGEAADESQPLMQLVVLNVLHVMAHVPHDVAHALKPGDPASLALAAEAKTRHTCRVLTVDPVIDAASGTCRVKLELLNPKGLVAAGARATVHFDKPKPAPSAERKP